jgi:hypothetical protein
VPFDDQAILVPDPHNEFDPSAVEVAARGIRRPLFAIFFGRSVLYLERRWCPGSEETCCSGQ